MAGTAMATNVRPFDPGTLGSLQTVFDNATTSGPGIDVVNDQISESLFVGLASGGSATQIIIEVAALEDGNVFGIYSAADPSAQKEVSFVP